MATYALNRLLQTQDALGRFTTLVYDTNGNVTASIDALGQRTTFTYDKLNRQITVERPEGGITLGKLPKDLARVRSFQAWRRRRRKVGSRIPALETECRSRYLGARHVFSSHNR